MYHAILFAGMPFRRHVNGLEFCYRTLVECCGFKHENVFVLNYDRSLRHVTDDGVGVAPEPGNWPGDSTPYRIAVTDEGSRRAFRNVIELLADRLTPDDQLFIHTTGHGGHHGDGRGPHLAVYPHWEDYRVGDFCSDLSQLPPHRSLLVLMAQCCSGGFTSAVVRASRAKSTFVTAAAAEGSCSYAAPDGNWDSFARDLLSALGGRTVSGLPLALRANGCARVPASARAAFEYASHPDIRSPLDSPEYAQSSPDAGDISLATRRSVGPHVVEQPVAHLDCETTPQWRD